MKRILLASLLLLTQHITAAGNFGLTDRETCWTVVKSLNNPLTAYAVGSIAGRCLPCDQASIVGGAAGICACAAHKTKDYVSPEWKPCCEKTAVCCSTLSLGLFTSQLPNDPSSTTPGPHVQAVRDQCYAQCCVWTTLGFLVMRTLKRANNNKKKEKINE